MNHWACNHCNNTAVVIYCESAYCITCLPDAAVRVLSSMIKLRGITLQPAVPDDVLSTLSDSMDIRSIRALRGRAFKSSDKKSVKKLNPVGEESGDQKPCRPGDMPRRSFRRRNILNGEISERNVDGCDTCGKGLRDINNTTCDECSERLNKILSGYSWPSDGAF